MNKRYLDKLIKILRIENLDAMLIVPSEELELILSGRPLLCERFQGLFIKSDGEYFYYCNLLTKDEMSQLIEKKAIYTWFDNECFTDNLEVVLKEKKLVGSRIGFNGQARAFNILEIMNHIDIKFVNGKNLIEQVNMIKEEEELNLLRLSAQKADRVMKKAINFIRPGIRELDIIEKINKEFIKEGCVPDFALVASGPNSALPHYTGLNRMILENDIVLIDIGAKFKGMSSDITRTVFVGEPTEEMKKIYSIVLESNRVGEKNSIIGKSVALTDSSARQVIEDAGYGEYFTTRLGHGIGYSTHEEPYINKLSKKAIMPGMAFTIEPGIYLPGKFGIRIEDSVLVTQEGVEIINKVTKEMIVIK